jgi:hypothetical protein
MAAKTTASLSHFRGQSVASLVPIRNWRLETQLQAELVSAKFGFKLTLLVKLRLKPKNRLITDS